MINFGSLIWRLTVKIFRFWRCTVDFLAIWRLTVSPIEILIWRHNVSGEQNKFPATISLYGACSEDLLVQRSLGY